MTKDKPSRTAYKVAMGIVTLGSKPGMENILPMGIVEASKRLLVASKVVKPWMISFAQKRCLVSLYESLDCLLPGQFEALAYRKAFFERHVIEGIEAGATQVLVLGAGYDTLAWRLSKKYTEIKFFEIDHPATARLKNEGIAELGQEVNHHLISEDLGQKRLNDLLNKHEYWNPEVQSVFLAEGLLMYLPHIAVKQLFLQCSQISGYDSSIVFSYIPADESGNLNVGRNTRLMLWLQEKLGEPWIWSIRPKELKLYLHKHFWSYDPDLPGATEKRGVEFFVRARKR